jgi:hypothetical protein
LPAARPRTASISGRGRPSIDELVIRLVDALGPSGSTCSALARGRRRPRQRLRPDRERTRIKIMRIDHGTAHSEGTAGIDLCQ